jgi:hypothetical protein
VIYGGEHLTTLAKIMEKSMALRELTSKEVAKVAGGLAGTQIPFTNSFIRGPNWPGGGGGVLGGLMAAYGAGSAFGGLINDFNMWYSGMSLGQAMYRTRRQINSA